MGFLDFAWWKLITIVVLEIILLIWYKLIQPVCGSSPCMSTLQYFLLGISIILTLYLLIAVISSSIRKIRI